MNNSPPTPDEVRRASNDLLIGAGWKAMDGNVKHAIMLMHFHMALAWVNGDPEVGPLFSTPLADTQQALKEHPHFAEKLERVASQLKDQIISTIKKEAGLDE